MGIHFEEAIQGGPLFACRQCSCHLAHCADVVADSFTGKTGKAFLIQTVINFIPGPKEEKRFITGKVRMYGCKRKYADAMM